MLVLARKLDEAINKIDSHIQVIRMEIERLNLLNKGKEAEKLQGSIQALRNNKGQLILQKITTLFLKFSNELKGIYLLNKAHVALVPGEAFGSPKCIRFSYATSNNLIKEAIKRIKAALEALR